ncbi:MAG: hypothetical protein NUW01_14245 [Gemmatimonadaceae bacterium]|nr:hypothetical protein [Gemmatimonadaceae bacterium]
MSRSNPFDNQADFMTAEMEKIQGYLETMGKGVQPFNSQKLSPQEEDLMYDHPSTLFSGETNQQTGAPYTDTEAAQELFQQMGPVEYVKFVEGVHNRRTGKG